MIQMAYVACQHGSGDRAEGDLLVAAWADVSDTADGGRLRKRGRCTCFEKPAASAVRLVDILPRMVSGAHAGRDPCLAPTGVPASRFKSTVQATSRHAETPSARIE